MRAEAHDMQDRAEHFLLQIGGALKFDDGRRHEQPVRRQRVVAGPSDSARCLACLPIQPSSRSFDSCVDHRTDMGRRIARIAEHQFARRARDHLEDTVGDILLHAEQPQRRAALAGGAEHRADHVVGHLLGQRGGIDDHRVDAAGLGDERHDRPVLARERAVDDTRRLRSSR